MLNVAQAVPYELTAPEGGVLYRLNVHLTRFRTWEAAIRAGAPDTTRSNSVRRVGCLFEPPPAEAGPVSLVLLWMGKESVTVTRQANAWATQNGLLLSSPYHVLALSAKFPYLYEEYGLSGAGFVATQVFRMVEPYVCGVWQSKRDTKRHTELVPTDFQFLDRTMFVYREL